jgi:hypothetical protein
MTVFLEDNEKLDREDATHTRRGSCLALFLLFLIVPPTCWAITTFTTPGQSAKAYGALYYAYSGIPGVTMLAGLPQLAKQSCTLDRTQPAGYRETQEDLKDLYETKSKLYREQWAVLVRLKQDTSWFDPPEEVPADINGGKITFCR